MKIRQQRVHDLKLGRRENENIGFSLVNIEFSGVPARRRFPARARVVVPTAMTRWPDFLASFTAATVSSPTSNRSSCILCSASVFGFHRQKSASADVQGDKANFHAARADFFQQLRREMQARGRRGHGAGGLGKNSLIALLVFRQFVLRAQYKVATEFRRANPSSPSRCPACRKISTAGGLRHSLR